MDYQAPPLDIPTVRKYGLVGVRRKMRHEISELRTFASDLAAAMPEDYADLLARTAAAQTALDEATEKLEQSERETQETSERLESLRQRLIPVEDTLILQEIGVYEYRHEMESSDGYRDALRKVRDDIKAMARKDGGAVASQAGNWTVNGNAAQGRKMIRDTSKLLLRAYNNEASALVDKLRPFKLDAAIARLGKSRDVINKLGAEPMSISISSRYHNLRTQELSLHADWLAKKEDERAEAKAEQERLRDEAKALREIENERQRLLKERAHYANTIQRLQESEADSEELQQLTEKLSEINAAVDSVDKRAANTRAGYVYVISNIGSFGGNIVKIGMTRRLEPMDRVKELGDASVPFRFDLHALAFSEDAVDLEQRLHGRFANRRVNLVNLRREFFYITPADVKAALSAEGLTTVITEFVDEPEAGEWRQSEAERKKRNMAHQNDHF